MREGLKPATLRRIYDRVARRYDFQHGFLTARSDQRGRVLLVDHAVRAGDRVLDCGAGTGTTGLLAARSVGPRGTVALIDMSEGMLAVAREKAARSGLGDRVGIGVGDMCRLPFPDAMFDVTLSTYSMCPLYDPAEGARELYRVTKPGGRIGVAHSTEPDRRMVKWLADRVESVVWHLPGISLGCRSVTVLPTLEGLGCRTLFRRHIGIPLWPFLVFVMEKPASTPPRRPAQGLSAPG